MTTAAAPSLEGGRAPVTTRSWILLALGVGSASFSAIFIRYADDAPALAISLWRCGVGALVLAPFAARGLRRTTRAELGASVVAGLFLAVHFATWITSLELTTVASSVLLVSTTPIFVALSAWFLWRERLVRSGWLGIFLALAGTALIGGGDLSNSSLSGDLLALIGGATAGGYILAGGVARRTLGILEYASLAYATAAIVLLPICLAWGVDLGGYGATTWWAIVAIIVGPQLLGHTIINLVVKDIDATTVSVAIMAEPVIAIAAALVLFSEVPSALVYPGGAAILAGIYLVTRARAQAVPIVE